MLPQCRCLLHSSSIAPRSCCTSRPYLQSRLFILFVRSAVRHSGRCSCWVSTSDYSTITQILHLRLHCLPYNHLRVVAKDELDGLLSHPLLGPRVPVLFLANKMDLPTALSPVDVAQALGLVNIRDRPWHIMPSNALTGDGLEKGMEWIAEKLIRR